MSFKRIAAAFLAGAACQFFSSFSGYAVAVSAPAVFRKGLMDFAI